MNWPLVQGALFLLTILGFWGFLHAKGRHHTAPANATIERLQRELNASQAREYRLEVRVARAVKLSQAMLDQSKESGYQMIPAGCVAMVRDTLEGRA